MKRSTCLSHGTRLATLSYRGFHHPPTPRVDYRLTNAAKRDLIYKGHIRPYIVNNSNQILLKRKRLNETHLAGNQTRVFPALMMCVTSTIEI